MSPDTRNWKFETGGGGWGNQELETYCAPQSAAAPCVKEALNAFEQGGYLHIVARHTAAGGYTSARLKSEGLRSFQYGRIEARIRIPKGQGVWPAFWMLGDNIGERGWPASGELDIMENVGHLPATLFGSVHGTGFSGTPLSTSSMLAEGKSLGDDFHVYGMLWSPGRIDYYYDDPSHIYATYTQDMLPPGAVWPFDSGKQFLLLNLAIGGDWPGSPDATTRFPAEMLVDYVRVYALSASEDSTGASASAPQP